jgi:hypothetical protein
VGIESVTKSGICKKEWVLIVCSVDEDFSGMKNDQTTIGYRGPFINITNFNNFDNQVATRKACSAKSIGYHPALGQTPGLQVSAATAFMHYIYKKKAARAPTPARAPPTLRLLAAPVNSGG